MCIPLEKVQNCIFGGYINQFFEYVDKWKKLEGSQILIARNYLETSSDPIIPSDGEYHKICYTRFTDSQKIVRVLNSMKKKGKFKSLVAICNG